MSKNSRFYLIYPSRNFPQEKSKVKKAYFEIFSQIIGLEWDPTNKNIMNILSSNYNNGGIFFLIEPIQEALRY